MDNFFSLDACSGPMWDETFNVTLSLSMIFRSLIEFMTSGDCMALVLGR